MSADGDRFLGDDTVAGLPCMYGRLCVEPVVEEVQVIAKSS